MSRRRNL